MMTFRSSFNKVIIGRDLRIEVPVEKCTAIKPVVIAFLFAVKVMIGVCVFGVYFSAISGVFFSSTDSMFFGVNLWSRSKIGVYRGFC